MGSAGLRVLAAMAAALLVGGLLVAIAGQSPGVAGLAMLRGAFGSPDRLAVTLNKATPYLLVATGVALCFRAGLVNIGGEGQIALGGLAATMLALRLGDGALVQPLALLAAVAAGAAWSGLAGVLLATRGVHEVLGTLLLNFVGVLAVAAALHGPLGEAGAGFPQSPLLDPAAWLPKPWPGTELHIGLALAVAAALAAQAVLWRSVVGFHWRVLGQSPRAARYAGLHPGWQRVGVMAAGGALAGLAGGIEVLGVHYRLIEGFSTGFGFTAIAIALAAAASPLAAIPAAIFFAALESGALAMQRQTGLPAALVLAIEGLALLFVLMAQGTRVGARR